MKNIFGKSGIGKTENLISVLMAADDAEKNEKTGTAPSLQDPAEMPEKTNSVDMNADDMNIDVSDYIVSDPENTSDGVFFNAVPEEHIVPGKQDVPEEQNVPDRHSAQEERDAQEGTPVSCEGNETTAPSPCRVIIIGTAHVSEKSVAQVKEAIRTYSPDVVAVELCARRYKGLTEPEPEKEMSVKDIISGGKIYYHLLYMLLAHLQKKMGDQMGVPPGSEMIAAIEGAQETGAEISLIDRDIQVTFRRFIAKMSLWEKIRFFVTLLGGSFGSGDDDEEMSVENLTDQDVITALIEEFRKVAPTVAGVLIDERDAYLAANILRTIRKAGPGKTVVVVIGAGHRKGVMTYLDRPSTIPDPATLVVVPEKKIGIGKIIGMLMILIVFLLFGYILYSIATQPGLTIETFFLAFGAWFFINGALSALGAAVARGHYTSVVTAFCIAWLTSLNPFLAAGWFAGLAEARVRRPTTRDFSEAVSADTVSEMMSNNFFRVLAVAALANIGSVAGTFIGAYVVLQISGLDMAALLKEIIYSVI